MTRMLVMFSIVLVLGFAGHRALGDDAGANLAAAKRAAGTANGLCPVMQRPVTKQGGRATYMGEQIGFCCPGCIAKFQADPVRYMNAMRREPAKYAYVSKGPTLAQMTHAANAARSANGRCPVMGNLVAPNGGSVTYKGQQIAFCCPGCIEKFKADPEKYLRAMRADPLAYGYDRPGPTHAQLRKAREAARSVNGRCPVMGNLVTPQGGSVTYRGEKIGFCCPGCISKFKADPEGWMKKLRSEPAVYGCLKAP